MDEVYDPKQTIEILDCLWDYLHAAGTNHGTAKAEYEAALALLKQHNYDDPEGPKQ